MSDFKIVFIAGHVLDIEAAGYKMEQGFVHFLDDNKRVNMSFNATLVESVHKIDGLTHKQVFDGIKIKNCLRTHGGGEK